MKLTKAQAQIRMSQLAIERKRLQGEIAILDSRLCAVLETARELLTQYPTLDIRALERKP